MSPLPTYYQEDRPWGSFERFTNNEASTVKILHIASGKRFSLQRHRGRSEFWRVIEGTGRIQVGEEVKDAKVGDEFLLAIGVLHRIEGGETGIKVLEIAFGEFDENDIERLEDDFGRN
jgi:mannose-6-phosphate isomerase-like protein (cupin superfamily)